MRRRKPLRAVLRASIVFQVFIVLTLWGAPAALSGGVGVSLDPSARLPEGKKAWEYWDLVAEDESGYRIFARFMVTNVGPGSRNAVVMGHVAAPDGRIYSWDDGDIERDWTLAQDRLQLDIGGSRLTLRDSMYRLEVAKPDMRMDLNFAPLAGVPLVGSASNLPFNTEVLALSSRIEGRMGHPDEPDGTVPVNGLAAFTHSWGSEPEHDSILRRFDLVSMKDGLGFYVLDVTSSKKERNRWLLITRENEIVRLTSRFELETAGHAPDHREKRYWVPGKFQLNGDGLSGEAETTAVEVVINPLKIIPQPFRFFIGLNMKPHRVWASAKVDVTVDSGAGAPLHVDSNGTLVTTFLNSYKRPADN